MPHQCVRCKETYSDGAKEILSGCSCGARVFFFIKQERLERIQKERDAVDLSDDDRKQIENDIFDLVGSEVDKEHPIVLDFESIRVLKPGQYELDLVQMFKKEPLVFKLEEGKYMIDLAQTFEHVRKK